MYELSDVISKSFKLAWKHKFLWMFVVLAFGAGFTRPNLNGGGSDFEDTPNYEEVNYEENYKNYENYEEFEYTEESQTINNLNTERTSLSPKGILGTVLGTAKSVLPNSLLNSDSKAALKDSTDSSINTAFTSDIRESTSTEYLTEEEVMTLLDNDLDDVPYMMDDPMQYNSDPDFPFSMAQLYEEFSPMLSLAREFIMNIGWPVLILVIVGALFNIGLTIFISIFLLSWAIPATLKGIDDAIYAREYSLYSLSSYARTKVRKVFTYKLYVFLTYFIFLLTLLLIAFAYIRVEFVGLAILGSILLLVYVVFSMILTISDKFNVRFLALTSNDISVSFKNGVRLSFRNLWKYFLQGFVLGIARFAYVAGIIIALGLVFGAFALATYAISDSSLVVIPIILGSMLFPVVVIAISFAKAYLVAATQFSWSFFFNYAILYDDLRINSKKGNFIGQSDAFSDRSPTNIDSVNSNKATDSHAPRATMDLSSSTTMNPNASPNLLPEEKGNQENGTN